MYGATEELWFPEWEFHGTPWENPGLYARMSPSSHARRFKTPMLVIHGELDFRVPIGEGLQLFTALQRMNVPSKFLYFPDEGHWVLKPQNSELWYTTVLDWIDRYTK
jgi:dipeptidyl aminopeptidase/acylaminoacyl peptidase